MTRKNVEKEIEQPSYYAVIPATVRYNENLTPHAKLLYGEITALCNKYGYCFANNKYFTDLYKVTIRSVSNWLAELEREEFILAEIDKKEGNKRKIYLTHPIEKKVQR